MFTRFWGKKEGTSPVTPQMRHYDHISAFLYRKMVGQPDKVASNHVPLHLAIDSFATASEMMKNL